MNALPLVCLCVLTRTGTPSADGHGPEVIKVEQDSDAMLPCSLGNKQNMESGLFHWKKAAQRGQQQKEVFFYEAASHYNNGLYGQSDEFKGRVAYFQDELKHGNASIVLRNTKMADGGNYSCAFPLLQTPQTFYVELVVGPVLRDRSGGNIAGAAPKPSVTSLDETETWSLLQCEAHGNPAPAVRWEDGSGKLLSAQEAESSRRGSSVYVKVTVTVNQTDRYRCVATQEGINHRVHADTFVRMSHGAASKPAVTSLDETKEWAWLQCVVRGASPDLRLEWEDASGNSLAAHKPTLPVGGANYDIILNVTVTQTDRYRCVATDRTNQRSEAETYVYIAGSSGWSSSTVAAVVVTAVVTLSLVAVVQAVLVCSGYISLRRKSDSSGNKEETKETDSLKSNV